MPFGLGQADAQGVPTVTDGYEALAEGLVAVTHDGIVGWFGHPLSTQLNQDRLIVQVFGGPVNQACFANSPLHNGSMEV